MIDQLEQKITDKTARIAIIGLGYVGLPLALQCAKSGYAVVGLDVNQERMDTLAAGKSYIMEIPTDEVAEMVRLGRLQPTTDYERLRPADVIFICVPTPATKAKAPDTSHVEAAARGIAQHLSPGKLVILQSTTYPGTTEEAVLPILEATGLRAGEDFLLAFSPERVDPGNTTYGITNTPKVVGGINAESARLTGLLFEHAAPGVKVHMVSTPRAAEMTKLLENIFRSVNIALVNELALLSERMGIDMWEVIGAAATKPFGYMPFYPGPGVGGHCIPIDPYYLSWKAREYDFYTKFIELAAETNQSMPYHLTNMIVQAVNDAGHGIQGANVLVLGVAFKRDVDDPRHSPAEKVLELLLARGAHVSYNDPYIPKFRVPTKEGHITLQSTPLTPEALRDASAVVIISGHRVYDYAQVVNEASLVVDAVNVTAGITPRKARIVRIGAPR